MMEKPALRKKKGGGVVVLSEVKTNRVLSAVLRTPLQWSWLIHYLYLDSAYRDTETRQGTARHANLRVTLRVTVHPTT